jgi:phospholipase A1
MLRRVWQIAAISLLALLIGGVAGGVSNADELERCLQEKLATAADTVMVGELRRQCRQMQDLGPETVSGQNANRGAVEIRQQQEREIVLKPFSVMTHKPNYILPVAYNRAGYSSKDDSSYDFDPVEAQFQISIKSPLVVGLIDDRIDIYAAYTNHSFWQVYNNAISSPFRETVHEPELWVQFNSKWDCFGIRNTWNAMGINHQSNGQSGDLSRSWNRLYASFVFEYGNLGVSLTPWYRLPESAHDDDNPDIADYLGHYEISATYKWDDHTFSLMTRNALESDFHRGAILASWSFPLGNWPYLRGYVQYFNGYGESLIDYDQYVNRVGVGFSLSDWL